MDKTYKFQGLTFMGNALRSQRDFVSWANVWLFFQVLFAINALMWSARQGIKMEALVVALLATWMFWRINKI